MNKQALDIDLLIKAAHGNSADQAEMFTRTLLEQGAMIADHSLNDRLLKELIMKYVESERKLRELDQLKNKFLGMAAHDLRNPLGSIRGFSELLLEGGAG